MWRRPSTRKRAAWQGARVKVIVTCGPSYEPIDEVRRITNFSSGALGVALANALARAGHEVVCFKGVAAVSPNPEPAVSVRRFTTNDDLLAQLRAAPEREAVGAVFHAAALADFKVRRAGGERKISSRAGEVTLTLVPATKLIGELRGLFPNARITGWKYELDGMREEALAKGARQIAENRTDGCVVNGAAYGAGFGVLAREGAVAHCADKAALCEWLAR